MQVLRALSEALAFALELAMLGAFGLWGFTLPFGASVRWSAGLGVPAATIALWSLCLAPRARRRLGRVGTAALSLALFELAAFALARAGHPQLALVFAAVALLSVAMTFALRR